MLLKINGERNSGTNFLYQLIKRNFVTSPYNSRLNISNKKNNANVYLFEHEVKKKVCYYWKHGIPCNSIKQNADLVVDLFIIRDLDSWLVSMFYNTYHLNKISEYTNFLTDPQVSNEKNEKDFRTMDVLNADDTGKNIFEIRYYKLNAIFDYFEKNDNVILVNLEYLQNPEQCKYFLSHLNYLYKINNDTTEYNIKINHTKTKRSTQINQVYNINNDDYRTIIDQNKNEEIESRIHNIFKIKKDNVIYDYNL